MEALSLKYIAAACDGELLSGSPDARVRKVCTDSRKASPGALFFALKGDKFDAHEFLPEAASKGIAAVVVSRSRAPANLPGCAIIAVDEPRRALGRLAAEYRKRFTLPVIAVGGSNGKTTTKDLVASVLKQKLTTLASEASFNNEIGVPLTLLKLRKAHQAAVLEVGTNHPGELEPLVVMVAPRYGIITSIGREHLEFFTDLAGVAREEGRLAELLPGEGRLFINGDNEWCNEVARRTRAEVTRVGIGPGNDWRATDVRLERHGATFFVNASAPDYAGEYRIHLLGRHQVVNALFAIAVGAELGLERNEIEGGLESCKPPKMRLQLRDWRGVRVLNDAYNANADSMLAALQTLQDLPCEGRRVAVLGDMAELGTYSEEAHEEVGRRAAELGVGQLFAIGKMAPIMARGARGAGLKRVLEFADVESAAAAVKSFVRRGDVLLLKASRAARLERVAELLAAGTSGREN